MYKDTITLFNRREGDRGDTWYPTVLRNVQLNMDRAAIVEKYGAEATDNAVLHIRFTKGEKTPDIVLVSADGYILCDKNGKVLCAKTPEEAQTVPVKLIGSKTWLPPKQWDAQVLHSDAITFTTGARFDFFWLGDWGNEKPVHDSDYRSYGDFYSYMNKTYDYVFAVSTVGGPYSLIPHFEIMGK